MTRPPHLRPVEGDGGENPWNEIMDLGAAQALRRMLAKKPFAIVIIGELADSFHIETFPPGEAAARWMIRELATQAAEDGGGADD